MVCLLARFWLISRSVKNASRAGATALMALLRRRRRDAERPGPSAPATRTSTKMCLPVGCARDRSTATAGGPGRLHRRDTSRAGCDRETVAEVMHPGTGPGSGLQPGVVDQSGEHRPSTAGGDSAGPAGDEEAGRPWTRAQLLAQLGIAAQRRDCGGLHRYPSSLVVLGLADHDHTGVEVDIIAVEADGLAHPHAGSRHQPDQRVICRGGQRPGTLRCRRQQPG